MAGCETLLLLNLHRAFKFHYETGEHLDCCLGQDILNSVLMVLRCHPAPQNILCAAEASSSGQMKIWSCSFSKWSLITYHTLDAVLRVQGVWHQLRQGPWSLGEFTLQQRRWFVSVWKTLQQGGKGAAEEVMRVPRRELRLEAQWTFWKEVNSVLSFGESEYVNIQGRKIFVFIETFMILNYRKPILIKLKNKTKQKDVLLYSTGKAYMGCTSYLPYLDPGANDVFKPLSVSLFHSFSLSLSCFSLLWLTVSSHWDGKEHI